MLREGAMLGPYRLVRLIGNGGAGDVYQAEDGTPGTPNRNVAVKVLRGGPRDAGAREIVRQVRVATQARQAHVLPIYDAGESGDALFIAMAYAPGGSLGTAIQPGAQGRLQLPLSPGVTARFISQAARALRAMHQRGLVHGDLKPNNLFVRTAPNGGPIVAIADFGQASVVRSAALAAASAMAPGDHSWAAEALRYAAPEQLAGEAIAASDQYALAVIAFVLLTGRHPISAEGPMSAEALLHTPPTPPSRLDSTIGSAADAVLLRALAKAPEARFPDIATFAQALDDGLAASVVERAGVTQEFRALAGSSRATMPPSADTPPTSHEAGKGPGAFQSGTVARGHADALGVRAAAPGSGASRSSGLDRGVLTPVRGRLAALSARQRVFTSLAAVVLLAVLVAGGIGIRAMLLGAGASEPLPNVSGLDYAPTVTPNAAQQQQYQAAAQVAEHDLTTLTSGQPQFRDALTSNVNRWAIDGTQSFFGSDKRLHLNNHNLQAVYSINQPVAAPMNFVLSVRITFVRGSLADLAGVRIRVAPATNGAGAHDTILLAPDGQYEVWRFDGERWQGLDYGYTMWMNRGMGQTNGLTVLARGSTIEVFINDHYVTTVSDKLLPLVPDMTMGPTVIDADTEVAYANYTVYAVPG